MPRNDVALIKLSVPHAEFGMPGQLKFLMRGQASLIDILGRRQIKMGRSFS